MRKTASSSLCEVAVLVVGILAVSALATNLLEVFDLAQRLAVGDSAVPSASEQSASLSLT